MVDDAVGIGLVLRRHFERQGHTCEHIASGEAALARLDRAPRPDVALIDLVMPGMSGRELVAAVRERPGLADLPMIILSGYGAVAQELPPPGTYQAVVAKPFDLKELDGVLSSVAGAVR